MLHFAEYGYKTMWQPDREGILHEFLACNIVFLFVHQNLPPPKKVKNFWKWFKKYTFSSPAFYRAVRRPLIQTGIS